MFSQLKSIGSNKCCERNFINTNLGTKFFFGGSPGSQIRPLVTQVYLDSHLLGDSSLMNPSRFL